VLEEEFEDIDAEQAVVEDLQRLKEQLKRVVYDNRVNAARRELREARQASIATSDLEKELEEHMKHTGDYKIIISFIFRLNSKRTLTKILPDTTRFTFDLLAFEETFLTAISPYTGDGQVDFTYRSKTAVVKHTSGRGGSRRHDFEEFTHQEGDQIMEIMDQHRTNFRKGELLLIFEISTEADKTALATVAAATQQKRARRPVDVDSDILSSSPPPQPEKKRLNRGERLQEQHTARLDTIRAAGDFQRQLMDRWRCREENCTNKNNYCFINPANHSHYNITVPQHETWANAISSNEATLQCPPIKLLHFWEQEQGSINRLSRQPTRQSAIQEAKSTMERLAEMQAHMQEQMMQQRMFDQMEAFEEKQERREERNLQRQMQKEQRDHLIQNRFYMTPQFHSQLPQSTSYITPLSAANIAKSPLQHPAQPPLQPCDPAPEQRYSSPINIEEEEADILVAFFDWKIANTRNTDRKAKWLHARNVVIKNDWSIIELQQMQDGISAMYQRAIQAGISDGFARGFRAEIHAFKQYYRHHRDAEAAVVLNGLGGGFIPGSIF
jgi:hypothetical protein